MHDAQLEQLAIDYRSDGVVTAPVMTAAEAEHHRRELDRGEAELGPLHYIDKVHTVMQSPYGLATDSRVLDVVQALIGPNVCSTTPPTSSRNQAPTPLWHGIKI